MRLIDADALYEEIDKYFNLDYGETLIDPCEFSALVNDAPTVDAVEVVRCENCIYRGIEHEDLGYCYQDKRWHLPWDYCSCGVRKEGAENV